MTAIFTEQDFLRREPSLAETLACPRRLEAQRLRYRVMGAGIMLALHALGGMLFYFGASFAKEEKKMPVMNVAIIEPIAEVEQPTIPQAQMVRPEMPQFVPPIFEISSPAPTAITVVPPAPAEPLEQRLIQPISMTTGSRNDYLSRLTAQLHRFKRYPATAKAARRQGVVMLHFVMNAAGHVILAEIHKSSGVKELDAEALALVARAEPLPPIPAGFGRDTIDAVVPIEFYLR